MIILVGGRAGEGKTTFSNFCIDVLNDLGHTSAIVPFAKGVKDTARFMGWDSNKDDKGRRLLQLVGYAGREYDKNIWAQKALDTINEEHLETDYIFIDDWRFPNEERFMTEHVKPLFTVRIRRPREYHTLLGTDLYNDVSETSLPDDNEYYDFVIENNEDLEHLKNLSKSFVDSITRR